ncbi:MAG: hypothetical protein AAF224_05865 [Pseudomonadota bacterium]
MTVLALILTGVFTFSAFVVLSAYAPLLRDHNDGGAHALSKSAIGYAFLFELLNETGVAVSTRRDAATQANAGVLVYTPGKDFDLRALGALNPYQITAVILPKWSVSPSPDKQGWVQRTGSVTLTPFELTIGDQDIVLELERRQGVETVIIEAADATGGLITRTIPSRNIGAVEKLQFLKPDDTLEPILTTKDGAILFAKVANQPLYIIADADLANTQGIANVDRAKVTAIFFDYARAGGAVVFDLSLHGIERTRNIMRLALEPPFMAATLCALFAFLLLALKAAARFGPVRAPARPFEAGKAALADNSAALIRMAKREEAFGARYVDMTRRQIGKAIGAPKKMSPEALDALIDTMAAEKMATDKTNANYLTLVQQMMTADGIGPFVRAARGLYQFKKEIMRDDR